ncbi:MAG TPA: hypothetical protein PLO37_14935 [Candidatus Hydrogenedentes bacterium]|nr:hypothetical protein [Candidatus Hydrogenedentota bacterium]HPG68142.1 hypothetical protein [Candidatus Hydrogenedentota bacterium]
MKHVNALSEERTPVSAMSQLEKQALIESVESVTIQLVTLIGFVQNLKTEFGQ